MSRIAPFWLVKISAITGSLCGGGSEGQQIRANRIHVARRRTGAGWSQAVQLILVRVVDSNRTAPPITCGAHPFLVGSVFGEELNAQRLSNERFTRDPGVIVAGRQSHGFQCARQHITRASRRALAISPSNAEIGGTLERELVGRSIHFRQNYGRCAGRQLAQTATDRRQRGLVPDQQMPVIVGRDDKGPTRSANGQRIADTRLFGPTRRGPAS